MMFESRPRVSSNSFANGSNQNCGNSIGDIPSTRVAAPPGGKSSLCLGWETATTDGSHRPRKESSNNYASGQSQNTGNVLTGVPTTRVSRPPGGHSEMSLAWTGHENQKAETFGQRVRVSSNSFANGADQNCGNVLSDTPTTRVLRPPGGGSSLNLGWAWNPWDFLWQFGHAVIGSGSPRQARRRCSAAESSESFAYNWVVEGQPGIDIEHFSSS